MMECVSRIFATPIFISTRGDKHLLDKAEAKIKHLLDKAETNVKHYHACEHYWSRKHNFDIGRGRVRISVLVSPTF